MELGRNDTAIAIFSHERKVYLRTLFFAVWHFLNVDTLENYRIELIQLLYHTCGSRLEKFVRTGSNAICTAFQSLFISRRIYLLYFSTHILLGKLTNCSKPMLQRCNSELKKFPSNLETLKNTNYWIKWSNLVDNKMLKCSLSCRYQVARHGCNGNGAKAIMKHSTRHLLLQLAKSTENAIEYLLIPN